MAKQSDKKDMNSRERRAAQRAAQGVSAPQVKTQFLNTDEIRGHLLPIIEEFNLYLEELRARGAGSNKTLEVVVDLPEDRTDFVSLDTLAEVSQALSKKLDEIEDGDSPYTLEVTSPGATRSLTERRHWKRSAGRLIAITTADGEKYLARLNEVTEEGPVMARKKETKKGQKPSYRDPETIGWGTISSAKVEIEFNS